MHCGGRRCISTARREPAEIKKLYCTTKLCIQCTAADDPAQQCAHAIRSGNAEVCNASWSSASSASLQIPCKYNAAPQLETDATEEPAERHEGLHPERCGNGSLPKATATRAESADAVRSAMRHEAQHLAHCGRRPGNRAQERTSKLMQPSKLQCIIKPCTRSGAMLQQNLQTLQKQTQSEVMPDTQKPSRNMCI